MTKDIIINIIRFILLILLQVLVLNHINLGGYLNPYVYVMFILLLPFETPKYLLLISAFSIGFTIDLFTGSMGMHAAASTFMAFLRPSVSRIIHSRKEYEPGIKPGINDLGIKWFVSYTLLLVFAHHFVLFFIEAFRFSAFFDTLTRIVLSTLLSTLLIVILNFMVKRGK